MNKITVLGKTFNTEEERREYFREEFASIYITKKESLLNFKSRELIKLELKTSEIQN